MVISRTRRGAPLGDLFYPRVSSVCVANETERLAGEVNMKELLLPVVIVAGVFGHTAQAQLAMDQEGPPEVAGYGWSKNAWPNPNPPNHIYSTGPRMPDGWTIFDASTLQCVPAPPTGNTMLEPPEKYLFSLWDSGDHLSMEVRHFTEGWESMVEVIDIGHAHGDVMYFTSPVYCEEYRAGLHTT